MNNMQGECALVSSLRKAIIRAGTLPPEDFHLDISEFLRGIAVNRDMLTDFLRWMSRERTAGEVEVNHETATHYKWFVMSDAARGINVWLHEYKPVAVAKRGHANMPHNHRYWFSSMVMLGGFVNEFHAVVRRDFDITEMGVVSTERLIAGSVYTMEPSRIHSLSGIEEPTLTLIVAGPVAVAYSESFDKASMLVSRHYPFVSKIGAIMNYEKLI